ncbi:general substrate transporter [Lyophyllum atratum]|nr:general substrate transporter [Lyophyllum atratum]
MSNTDFDTPEFHAEVASYALSLRGRKLTAALAFVTGTGFTLFGHAEPIFHPKSHNTNYDQGVMSSLLTAKQFLIMFPEVAVSDAHPNHATLQSLLVAIYEIGCLVGALSNLRVGDWLGRRRTIILGGVIMVLGAILQAASYSYVQILVARVITGLGNGLNTSTVPTYHSECAPAAHRGSLIMIEGSLITFGIMISASAGVPNQWIDFALFWVSGSSAQWRVPIALQIIFALVMICSIGFLPESPRWLIKAGRPAEAMAVISALDDKPTTDPEVRRTFSAIREAVEVEAPGISEKATGATSPRSTGRVPLKELFTGGRSQNFRRVALGVVIQCFQQITGINLITYYATLLFERLGISDTKSRIIAAGNATEYFIASLVAIFIIDRIGRRKLMLFGATGQCITMVLLAVLGSINNSSARVISAVLLFVFNSFFAVGWLGMTWLYPAEIVGLRTRGPANALSTASHSQPIRMASNWTWNFLVVMITGPSFQNIQWRTYIVFASLNAFIVPCVYFFFPETAGRSLEDMNVIFALAYNEGISPVEVSLRKDIPLSGSPEAAMILNPDVRGDKSSSRKGQERK